MAIFRIDQNSPLRQKLRELNSMILELDGSVDQGRFSKNELDIIYDSIPLSRKFLRDVGLGNTLTSYTGWSHIQDESGYGIWKYTPSNYTHNALNKVYLNGQVVENRGSVASESLTTFVSVFLNNLDSGSGFVSSTVEAGTEGGTPFEVMDTKNDFLYLGAAATFGGAKFEWDTRGSNYTLKVEYWTGTEWLEMTAISNDLEDGTNNFQSDGHITYTIPSNWNTRAINSVTQYWLRISSTTDPITVATALLIVPATSIIGVLALSSTELIKGEWAWASYNDDIYVTLPDNGSTSTEGTDYITSTSSVANLKNYFVLNRPITADYEDSRYNAMQEITADYSILETDGILLSNASGATAAITLTLPEAHTNEGMQFLIKRVDASPNNTIVATESGETIDGAGSHTLSSQYAFIGVISDNANWYIISGGGL